MFTLSDIFFELIYSTLLSDLYGLMRSILYLICTAPHFKFTVPLAKHYFITNEILFEVLNL